ncbi:hypothetical protein R1479_03221 [Ralstonia mannitolilytica]|uniref:DUF2933 domain-containing protein n=1 Tax=Ralstonia mannitolilytica TaxID=105219 RepID=UPI0028F5FD71|nr:DUF2933 domain-containing protein [Ralstonia mannitolilytica]CAJ0886952.1 hypothetical protein R1479_03221 [Ralstonia mannitolilytica]
MENHEHGQQRDDAAPAITRSKLALVGFLSVVAYFLWTEHQAHVIQFLPFLLLAACPLMHVFMHGGHSHRHHGHPSSKADRADAQGER